MNNMNTETKNVLKQKASKLALKGYDLTDKFPKDELYCFTAQARRSLVSIPSNVIEGYSRFRSKVFLNHLEVAYGSLAESKYQIYFAYKRGYIKKEEYLDFYEDAEEVSKILWKSIDTMYKKINKYNESDME